MTIRSNAIDCDGLGQNIILAILDLLVALITLIINYSFRKAFSLQHGVLPLLFLFLNPSTHLVPYFTSWKQFLIISYFIFFNSIHFLHNNNILSTFQFGFARFATLLRVKILGHREAIENIFFTVLNLIFFFSAFNTVDLDILLIKSFKDFIKSN